MSLELIADRTDLDVFALLALKEKIKHRTATTEEWTEWLGNLSGAYNISDLNRVGEAVDYLADLLNGYGYSVSVNPKNDWTASDVPRVADMEHYLEDVQAIKDRFNGSTPLPTGMDDLTVEDANNIEKLLIEVENYIIQIAKAFRYSGTFYAGEDGGLI